jgi:tetrahydromethanopterin S-methyltransferase subunit D
VVADNVVVTPNGNTAGCPAPQAAQVNVQPVQPVEAAPVVAPPHRTVVTEDRPHNYVATVFVSALLGGLGGALIGSAIYYLDTPRDNPQNIGYWAAGGVLVGTGIGIINVAVDESRAERAVATRLPSDPVPTYRVSLLQTRF